MSRKKEAFSQTWIEQGKRIKELRIAKGISQLALAELLGYSTANTVYYWESGRSGISYQQLLGLSKIFQVDIGYITGDQEHKNTADLICNSKKILDSCSPEYMKDHDTIANILCQSGYDLTVLEIENSNFMPFIKRHIAGLEDTKEIEKVINECMADYKLLKGGFGK